METLLDALLAKPFLEIGFERAQRLIFQREISGIRQLMRFPTRIQNGLLLCNVNAAIRFENIEKVLGNTDPLFPTITMPVHLLRPDKGFVEWTFAVGSSGFIERVFADIRQYLLPFIETMSVLETLKSQLLYEINYYAKTTVQRRLLSTEAEKKQFGVTLQNDGTLRLVLSPEQRVEKLAAIYVLEGRKDAAEHLVDSELIQLQGAMLLPPQIAQRLRWERLKKQLASE